MKKTISEFFENAEKIDGVKVNSIILDSVYIVSTSKKHSSGFKYLTIYGYDKNKDKHYLLSNCADLVDIHNDTGAIISIDYPRCNIQRLCGFGIKFKCSYFSTSTFRIEVLKKVDERLECETDMTNDGMNIALKPKSFFRKAAIQYDKERLKIEQNNAENILNKLETPRKHRKYKLNTVEILTIQTALKLYTGKIIPKFNAALNLMEEQDIPAEDVVTIERGEKR